MTQALKIKQLDTFIHSKYVQSYHDGRIARIYKDKITGIDCIGNIWRASTLHYCRHDGRNTSEITKDTTVELYNERVRQGFKRGKDLYKICNSSTRHNLELLKQIV